jgi:hypothetical protein
MRDETSQHHTEQAGPTLASLPVVEARTYRQLFDPSRPLSALT